MKAVLVYNRLQDKGQDNLITNDLPSLVLYYYKYNVSYYQENTSSNREELGGGKEWQMKEWQVKE